jgi:hypothetical protein
MAAGVRQWKGASSPLDVRLVLGGFPEAGLAAAAHAELESSGLSPDQLCMVCRGGQAMSDLVRHGGLPLTHREIDSTALYVSSTAVFDMVGLCAAEPFGRGAPWMPALQADALWCHIRGGWPALLVRAGSSDEQAACSRIQLRHHPRFLHMFNFTL